MAERHTHGKICFHESFELEATFKGQLQLEFCLRYMHACSAFLQAYITCMSAYSVLSGPHLSRKSNILSTAQHYLLFCTKSRTYRLDRSVPYTWKFPNM